MTVKIRPNDMPLVLFEAKKYGEKFSNCFLNRRAKLQIKVEEADLSHFFLLIYYST